MINKVVSVNGKQPNDGSEKRSVLVVDDNPTIKSPILAHIRRFCSLATFFVQILPDILPAAHPVPWPAFMYEQ